MSGPRRFDHEEAYARWQAGELPSKIAASYGVSVSAVYQLIARRDPEKRKRLNDYEREHQRAKLMKPCVRGCGRLAWHMRGRSGVCAVCKRAEQHAEALAQDNHGTETRYKLGCRCDLCRAGVAAAKRRRREASRVPCSHGCGTLVDSINRRNPEKPPECRSCSHARVLVEFKGTGRFGRRAAA